jgi:GntR family transcriptional regulator, transcriptional repressor for pyruvate dehydrogenase complex
MAEQGTTVSQRRPSKAVELASALRRSIVVAGLQPGAPLPSEAQLMAQQGLSRATVREAIRILVAEGLVQGRIGRLGGLEVAQPSPELASEWLANQLALRSATVNTLIEFRRIVEPQAAALAAERATPEQISLMNAAAFSGDTETELQIHNYVADATHNEILRLLLRAVHAGLTEHGVYYEVAAAEDASAGTRDHQRLFHAIANRDSQRAEVLMRRHLEAVERVVKRSGRLHDILVPRGPSAR